MKRFLPFFVLTLTLVASVTTSSGQTGIPESKRKLIAEMVTLFKMDKLMAEITDGILKSMETTYPIGFNAAIDSRTDLTAKEKEQLKATSSQRYLAFSRKFRERLPQVVDFGKYIEQSTYPLYDKFYTEEELTDLLKFYRSPTGQKVITTLPQLMAESNKMAEEKLAPQLIPLLKQLVQEDLDQVGSPQKKQN
jgi:hypothetical protein